MTGHGLKTEMAAIEEPLNAAGECPSWHGVTQQALHIRFLAIPGDHTVDGAGVPQVLPSWLIAAAVMTHQAGPNSESAEASDLH
jgi:hypothetical protein